MRLHTQREPGPPALAASSLLAPRSARRSSWTGRSRGARPLLDEDGLLHDERLVGPDRNRLGSYRQPRSERRTQVEVLVDERSERRPGKRPEVPDPPVR